MDIHFLEIKTYLLESKLNVDIDKIFSLLDALESGGDYLSKFSNSTNPISFFSILDNIKEIINDKDIRSTIDLDKSNNLLKKFIALDDYHIKSLDKMIPKLNDKQIKKSKKGKLSFEDILGSDFNMFVGRVKKVGNAISNISNMIINDLHSSLK